MNFDINKLAKPTKKNGRRAELAFVASIVGCNCFEEINKKLNKGVVAAHEFIAKLSILFCRIHKSADWETVLNNPKLGTGGIAYDEYIYACGYVKN